MTYGKTWHEGRAVRHHNLLAATQPPITGPIDRGKGRSNTAGKGKGRPKGATQTGVWQLIARQTSPTGGEYDFPSLNLSGYQRIVVIMDGFQVSTDLVTVRLQAYVGGSLVTSGYQYRTDAIRDDGTNVAFNDNAAASFTAIESADLPDATTSASAEIHISNIDVALHKYFFGTVVRRNESALSMLDTYGGTLSNTGTVDGLKFTASTGSLTAGIISIYGIRKDNP